MTMQTYSHTQFPPRVELQTVPIMRALVETRGALGELKGRATSSTHLEHPVGHNLFTRVVKGRMEGKGVSEPFKILSIDGGGVRGIFPAKILELMEAKLGINLHETFDLIVGTSTGSIIAAAIAVKYKLTQLVSDYHENAPKVFKKRWNFRGLYRSKYSSAFLESFLLERFGEVTLGEIEKPLILNATNVSVGDVHVFKSSYQDIQRNGDYVRDRKVPLYKAVLASCSAPTYFDPMDIDGTLICDGGIWANNPSLVGYADAIKNFCTDNVRILSLGTGQARQIYQPAKTWGYLTGWKSTKLVEFSMSCQVKFPQNVLQLIDSDKILRISPLIDNYGLDDHQNIPTLIELAKSEFTSNNAKISDFLNTEDRSKR